METIQRTATWWFQLPYRRPPKGRSPEVGDELIIIKGSSSSSFWVMYADTATAMLDGKAYVDSVDLCTDVLALTRIAGFPIAQNPPTPRVPPEARMLRVTELTATGFYAEVAY